MPANGPSIDFATIKAPGTAPTLTSIFQCSTEFLEQFAFWLEQRGLHIPISQVLGYGKVSGVRGNIDSDGSVVLGAGFTSSKTATGTYVITFDDSFASIPIVIANVTTSTALMLTVASVSKTATTLNVWDDSGTATDASLNFWAMPVSLV